MAANDIAFMQRNATNTGYVTRLPVTPTDGSNVIMYYDGVSLMAGYLGLGAGLSIVNGKLVSTASGVQGPAGPQGIQGEQGRQGLPGESAYQIASMYGNVGTEQEWIASLKGAKGDIGLQGATGIQGAKGDTGAQGVAGPKGDTGPKGDAGAVGPKGETGAQGIQGIQGVAGVNAFSAPVSRTVVAGTAYQTSTTKPTHVMLTLTSTSTISLTGSSNNTASIIIGPTAAVATGTGTVVGKYSNVLGGGLVVGLNLNTTQSNTYSLAVPAGWYYAVVVTTGTGLVIDNVVEQTAG